MKIFSWIHRKPRDNKGYALVALSKAPFGDDDDKLAAARTQSNHEEDRQALLLEHVGLVETLNGWRDGILTIGTFGFDEIVPEEDDAELTLDHDEAKKRELLTAVSPFACKKDEPGQVLGWNAEVGLWSADEYEIHRPALLQAHEESIVEVEKSERKEERARTTLADLFSRQDVHDEPAMKSGEKKDGGVADGGTKPACCTKPAKGMATAGSKGEEPGASTRIQKLMAKMLKRKIHPESENVTSLKETTKAKEIDECTTAYQESDEAGNQKDSIVGASYQRSKRNWMNKISVI